MKNVFLRLCLRKLIPLLIFSIIFIIGIFISDKTPTYVDSMITEFEELHTDGPWIDTTRVESLTPYFAASRFIISAGLQLLGISGIVATVLKKTTE